MDRTNSTRRSSWLLESIVGSPQPAAERAGVLGHREVNVAIDLLMYPAADAVAQVLVQPGVGFRDGTCSSASRRGPARRRRRKATPKARERALSRPLEDCEGCPRACWSSQSRSGRSQRRSSRFTLQFRRPAHPGGSSCCSTQPIPSSGAVRAELFGPTPSRNDRTCRADRGGLLRMEPHDDGWGSTLTAKRCEEGWTSTGGRA